MAYINEETDYVVGLEGKSGNPSPVTSFGVFKGILAAVDEVYGNEDLKGKKVAVQGLGAVGYGVCEYLHDAGAELFVTDIRKDSIDRVVNDFGATSVHPDAIYDVDCDIFVPCAMGAIINDFTIDKRMQRGMKPRKLAHEFRNGLNDDPEPRQAAHG